MVAPLALHWDTGMPQSLCETCSHTREIVSGRGSRFLMCERAAGDPRFPKYPPQPVGRCDGHEVEVPAQVFTIELLADSFAICRLDAEAAVPPWASGDLVFIGRTEDELSVVCSEAAAPDEVTANRGWRCFRVAGPLDFSLVGVIASLTEALARAGVSVFVTSTFDTDYLLVKAADAASAAEAWRQDGHQVVDAS